MGVDDTTPFALLPANINNEDELLEVATSREQQNLKDVICFYRLLTKFWFRQYDEASCCPSRRVIRFLDVYHKFYEGLTALHLARRRSEDEQKWTAIGEKATSLFQTWEGYCAWNFENKSMLLQAELHFLKGEHDQAEEKYKASIVSAYKHHFLHEEGLAMELSGMFYRATGKKEEAKTSLLGARACYTRWGADAIVPSLDSYISSL